MSLDLFQLLPAVYKIRDAELATAKPLLTPAETAEQASLKALTPPLSAADQARLDELEAKASRGPLESLLRVIGEQIEAVSYDLDRLYDDQFIETCAPWVIPYIGDLIGYQSIAGVAPADDPRAEVANTIAMRRRKGTILVLEELARDVTGWGAHAVEFFRTLGDTQYLNHIRARNFYAPDLRDWRAGAHVGTAFDRASHRVDVRRIGSRRGRYNIQNIGVFLWTLGAYGVSRASLAAAPANAGSGALSFRFHPLGIDAPLFHRAISQGDPIEAAATPANVPDRLERRVLCEDLKRGVGAEFYGETGSLVLYLNGEPVDPYQIRVADLSGADGAWANVPLPAPFEFAVDPELGRCVHQPAGAAGTLTASCFHGFNAVMGGGDYARSGDFAVTDPAWIVPFPDPRFATLADAVAFAEGLLPEHGSVAVEVLGDGAIALPAPLSVSLPAGATFELRAGDGARPTLWLDGEIAVVGAERATFILNGFIIAAGPAMAPAAFPASPAALVRVPALDASGAFNALGALQFVDCTLTPGWSLQPDATPVHPQAPGVIVEAPAVSVTGRRAILGAIAAHPLATVNLADCIVDATDRTGVAYCGLDGASGGGALTAEGCTIVGKIHASLITLASDCIFWSALAKGDSAVSGLVADRRQEGCVRFSFLPVGAVTPRRFECVELALASAQPLFFSLRYGHPDYAKLIASTPEAIRRGASDGGEMGAFHFAQAVQRETDLTIRLTECLPVGMEFGLIHQT